MKNAVKDLLDSDLLERYLIGETSYEENVRAEHFIQKYPEIREEYLILQDNLEHYSKSYATEAPLEIKDQILAQIAEENTTKTSGKTGMPWYFVAASIAALLFAVATVTLWKQNRLLSTENNTVVNQMQTLKSDIINANSRLENLKSKYAVLNDPETKKYVIVGNERAKNLKSVAYINPKERLTAINVLSLPELPEEKEFKMWAEVDGKMVCIGVLEQADRKLMSLPFADKASSYKITIDNKGNNDFAGIDSEVAKLEFSKE
ncbi:anti-sigma factor domain-containing protein [Robertkochia solimangrovi]|uniref:anti-sigma factor domain-containing protein n=1 Tax=Robertkochia solimangrovi TaxID=2213046 RepID=UPI00117F6B1F|nr:anti-sigma factor [Robertkochia solimangrovi]TRZ41441.1 RNA polymerase subunit sigma-70 [Robertkochia solimangrovi]